MKALLLSVLDMVQLADACRLMLGQLCVYVLPLKVKGQGYLTLGQDPGIVKK